MKIKTKLFGEIEVDEEKVIQFPMGLIGFEEYQQFMMIHSDADEALVMWLQSIEEPNLAFAVVDALEICPDYDPIVEDTLFQKIGEIDDGQLLVLVTMTIPEDVKKATANLKAPVIIHPVTRKGCQVIVENQEYLVRYPIYDIFNRKGED